MKSAGKKLAICGVILQLGIFIGPAITAAVMLRTFFEIHQSGTAESGKLAADMGFVLDVTVIGLAVALIGMILALIALFWQKYRARWFYRALLVFSVLWLFCVPLGTIFGLFLIIYLIMHRHEFSTVSGMATPSCVGDLSGVARRAKTEALPAGRPQGEDARGRHEESC
jgi:hypothetical protein